jgi:hypothetical protein
VIWSNESALAGVEILASTMIAEAKPHRRLCIVPTRLGNSKPGERLKGDHRRIYSSMRFRIVNNR